MNGELIWESLVLRSFDNLEDNYKNNHKSKRHGTKPMHSPHGGAFQRHQEHDLKHLGSVDLITTK
jgi:hypothetical protein